MTLVPSPHVVGDSLVLATIADDVALHDHQINTVKEFNNQRVNNHFSGRKEEEAVKRKYKFIIFRKDPT